MDDGALGETSGVLCDERMPSIRLKGKFYKTVVMYGSDYWEVERKIEQSVTETRTSIWTKERRQNNKLIYIRGSVAV